MIADETFLHTKLQRIRAVSGSERKSSKHIQSSVRNVICYLLDDEGILFSESTGNLYHLNTSAAFIWCCFEEGLAPLAIAEIVADKFGIARKQARQDVVRAFREWKAQGLLTNTETEVVKPQRDLPNLQPRVELNRFFQSPSPRKLERHYRVLDVHLRIRFPCRYTETMIQPVISHLEMQPHDVQDCFEVIIDITRKQGSYVVLRNGTPISGCIYLLKLAPVIQREALLSAYNATDCLLAIHAAAVSVDRQCVLLPGSPGSGKSILTAALMDLGFTYLTDELCLLMPDNHHIRPVTVSLGLKQGAWPVLASTYPFINSLTTHFQEDTTEVRYLPPPKDQLPGKQSYSIQCLVFPKYQPGESTALKKLEAAEALCRLTEAGYAVPGGLNKDCVEELINWITQLDCYELRMGDLTQAASEIKKLLS